MQYRDIGALVSVRDIYYKVSNLAVKVRCVDVPLFYVSI